MRKDRRALPHAGLNHVKVMDDDLHDLLGTVCVNVLKNKNNSKMQVIKNHLNTIIMVASDHGWRYGMFLNTVKF